MDEIYIKHPIESCNISQTEYVAKCPTEDRAFHIRMFNYGNATYRYHQVEPTLEDYQEWLDGLPNALQKEFKSKGFEACKKVLSLTRYVNEKRDVGMDEYIKALLKPEDWEAMQE